MCKGETTLCGAGGNLGSFITYVKNIHLQNLLHLILGFTFGVWIDILIFTKLMLFNII
jgi:hypothetical protein